MKQAIIRSVCECQAQLEARLDEHRYVLSGFAVGPDRVRERAPAHTMGAHQKRFDVGWLCPICGRNTLRSFDQEALAWRDDAPPSPSTTMPVQPMAPLGPGPATGLTSMPAPPLFTKSPAATPSRSPSAFVPSTGGSVPAPRPV